MVNYFSIEQVIAMAGCPDCSNGMQDCSETGIDCGGPDCGPCGTCDIPGNLVPNPSFECYSLCPDGITQVPRALPWQQPTDGTSDYWNACSAAMATPNTFLGFQNARTGVAYVGFYVYIDDGSMCPGPSASGSNIREYVQAQLLSPLVAGQDYCVQFYVSKVEFEKFGIDELGLYFSNTAVGSLVKDPLPYTPQVLNTSGVITDTDNWVAINGMYTAAGGEEYITIGNFNDHANTTAFSANCGATGNSSYYFLDDVYVGIDCTPLGVTLISFTAQVAEDNSVLLKWKTTTETNNYYFEIQKSPDGKTFEAIGTVQGASNSTRALSYQFEDYLSLTTSSKPTTLYYRLKQVDFDGKFTYSKTIAINMESNSPLSSRKVYDLYGRDLTKSATNLSGGIYIIKQGSHYSKQYLAPAGY